MKRRLLLALLLLAARGLFAASISGHVTAMDNGNPVIPQSIVDVLTPHDQGMDLVGRTEIGPDGQYTVSGLPVGQFLVRAGSFNSDFHPLFYPNAQSWHDAQLIQISQPNQNVSNIDFTLQSMYNEGEAVIEGCVVDILGNGVDHAQVFLYRDDAGWQYILQTETNENGHFEFEHLPAQTVYLAVMHWDFLPYFYPGVSEMWNAEPIELGEDTHIENLTCQLISFSTAHIDGVVRSASNSQPIPDARITALQPIPGSPTGYSVETESNGHYHLDLPLGHYILRAEAPDCRPQFWNHQDSFLNAEQLVLTDEADDVDFDLDPAQAAPGSISGAISIDGATPTQPCMVIVVSSDEEDGWEETAMMAADGTYTIPNLPNGEYYLCAFTSDSAPLYWVNSFNWEGAQRISVSGPVSGIDLSLNSLSDGGLVSLSGGVFGSGRTPLPNAAIIALNSDNLPVGCAQTNNEGAFDIPNLPAGVYNLIATKMFYNTVTQVELVGDAMQLDFTLNHATTANEPSTVVPPSTLAACAYPNPFNPQTTIAFTLPNPGRVEASIFNLRGEKVTSLYDGAMNSGAHQLTWLGRDDSGRNCASGVYLCRITAADSAITLKLAILK
jgi:hypothetical protein